MSLINTETTTETTEGDENVSENHVDETTTEEGGEQVTEENNEETGEDKSGESGKEEKLVFGKYKDIEAAEKGYKELTKKLREKAPEAPEAYNFDLSDDEDFKALERDDLNFKLDDDPLAKAVEPVFRKHNISQDAAREIAKEVLKYELAAAPDAAAEKAKLGADAEQMLKSVSAFVGKSFNDSEKQIAAQIATTAEGVKFLEKVSKLAGARNVPDSLGETSAAKTKDDYIKEAMDLKRSTTNFEMNTTAIRKYEALMDKAVSAQS